MYTNITSHVAQDRRRDMLAEAERARLARQAMSLARRAPQPPESRRRARQLRPQAQS